MHLESMDHETIPTLMATMLTELALHTDAIQQDSTFGLLQQHWVKKQLCFIHHQTALVLTQEILQVHLFPVL